MKIFKIVNILFVFVLAACNYSVNEVESIEIIEWDKVVEMDRLVVQDYFEHSQYIPLEVPINLTFYTSDKIQSHENYFFLGDIDLENTITIFDHSGRFINQIITGGNGPGEIPRMEDYTLHSDRNSLLILSGRRIFEFTVDGQHLKTHQLPKNEFFNFITYGGKEKVWLYTLPPASDEPFSSNFKCSQHTTWRRAKRSFLS